MHSIRQSLVCCALSFLLGSGIFAGYAYYLSTSVLKSFTHSEMIEDFSQGTAMVANLQNGNSEYALEFMILSLESSCEYCTSLENTDSISREHALSLKKYAQEVTGLCKD